MRYYDGYSYGATVSTGDTVGITILLIYLIILLVWGLAALIGYILKGIGMYTVAKRRGMDYPWLAYVPFARAYLQGELAGEIVLKEKKIQNPGIWLLALPFIHGAVFFIFYIILWAVGIGAMISSMNSYGGPGAGTVIALVVVGGLFLAFNLGYSGIYKVLQVLVDHQILERFTSKNMSIAHGVMAVMIPLYEPICFFVMRNKPFRPGMEPEMPMFTCGTSVQPVQDNGQETESEPVQESGFMPQRGLLKNMPESMESTEKTVTEETVESTEETVTEETAESTEETVAKETAEGSDEKEDLTENKTE